MPRETVVLTLCVLVLCMWLAPRVRAQSGISSLGSMYRVPWLEEPERRLRLSLSTGYGIFGDVLGASDVHHRVLLGAGAGFTMRSGLGLEARTDGRYDAHKLSKGSDSGAVLEPRFALRYARNVNERLRAGAQLGAWFPGRDFPAPAFDAVTLDLSAIAGVRVGARTDLSLTAGYRLDRSAEAIDEPERLSRADFMSLGLSSSDSVLAGLGLRTAYSDRGAVFGELSAELLVGSDAPALSKSPGRLGVGVDQAVGSGGTRVRAALNLSLSSRPRIDVTDPLVPLEPRVWLVAGITQDFLEPPRAAAETAEVAPPAQAPVVEEPAEAPPPAAEPPAVVMPRGVLRIFVRDTDWGEPMEASVTARVQGGEATPVTGRTDKSEDGVLELSVDPGRYEVLIEAKGYATQRRTIVVDEGGVTVLNVDLRPKEGR